MWVVVPASVVSTKSPVVTTGLPVVLFGESSFLPQAFGVQSQRNLRLCKNNIQRHRRPFRDQAHLHLRTKGSIDERKPKYLIFCW